MKANNDHVVICRVAYCDECYKAHRPSKQDLFVTIGRTHQKYSVRPVLLFGQRGFTPHIMQIQELTSKIVTYTSYCSIHECGCDISYQEEKEKYLIKPIKYTTHKVTTKEWNHMLLFKDDPDFYLD